MKGDSVFLDSNGLIALLNSVDWLQEGAEKVFAELNLTNRSYVTTDWILAETGNGLARSSGREIFSIAARKMLVDVRYHVIFVNDELFLDGLNRYQNRHDKKWGLIDCMNFEVMEAAGLKDAFTADRHFEQAGFHCLLGGRA